MAAFTGAYLAAIVLSTVGVGLLDFRWKLVFFSSDRVRALFLILLGVLIFVVWDLLGIATGTFFRGSSTAYIGIELAPELPLEEIFFLTFLCYLTLVVWRKVVQRGHS